MITEVEVGKRGRKGESMGTGKKGKIIKGMKIKETIIVIITIITYLMDLI